MDAKTALIIFGITVVGVMAGNYIWMTIHKARLSPPPTTKV